MRSRMRFSASCTSAKVRSPSVPRPSIPCPTSQFIRLSYSAGTGATRSGVTSSNCIANEAPSELSQMDEHTQVNYSCLAAAFTAFLDLAWVPSLNPCRNLRCTSFRWRILPLPVVFLRFALTLQLSAAGQDTSTHRDRHTHSKPGPLPAQRASTS